MTARSPDHAKRLAGIRAADMVEDGMVVGLGTGSTVFFAMERLSERISAGLEFTGIPTSFQAAIRARELSIPLSDLDAHPLLDLALDGADQVDPHRRLIKGRGAALTREKCVASSAKSLVIVVDSGKQVECLSAPVPVEVIPFAVTPAALAIQNAGGTPVLRNGVAKDGPVITDNGNFILDCRFSRIREPERLESFLTGIPGVLECGLFTGFCPKTTVVVGEGEGCRVIQGRTDQGI
ncbi:MAG: ribose-5-phosphate isomerase RpiA [Methanolinea sp.]|nr:ribose-5-phosphate isomerase RpiA [Methanolinea sp.]